jgi:hypothetical protein
VTKNILQGPGVFEFLILGGLVAGIPALITEFTLVSHSMPPEIAHILEVVGYFLKELTDILSSNDLTHSYLEKDLLSNQL